MSVSEERKRLKIVAVVIRRLRKRNAIVRDRAPHPEIVRLHPLVAGALSNGRLGRNPRQQPALRIAGLDVGIDVHGELMLRGLLAEAIECLAELRVRRFSRRLAGTGSAGATTTTGDGACSSSSTHPIERLWTISTATGVSSASSDARFQNVEDPQFLQ